MNKRPATLARKQLERRLAPLRNMPLDVPPKGWTKAIREALGMTARQLAARMGVAPSRITAIEQAEVAGATTLRTLRQAAAAMNCGLVYAFVPVKPLDEIVRAQAIQKAREVVSRVDHTMRLENQALLESDLHAEQQRVVERTLSGSLRGLWDEGKGHRA